MAGHSDIPSVQLLELLRDIIWQFTGPCKKLAFKFGQAGFLMQIADELAGMKEYINEEEVSCIYLALLIPYIHDIAITGALTNVPLPVLNADWGPLESI